jgi:hypothetical protein
MIYLMHLLHYSIRVLYEFFVNTFRDDLVTAKLD